MSALSQRLLHSLRIYRDRRLAIVFLLGFSSGLPWVLIGSSMTAWLQEAGLSRTAIGVFGSVFAVYTFNFLWAPLVDRVRLPLVGHLGQRRGWIVGMQGLIMLLTATIGTTDPTVSMIWISLLALLIALASATQDIAIDAYRIELIGQDDSEGLAAASAITTAGWWTGFGLPGALALILTDVPGVGWDHVYWILAGIVAVLIGFTLRIPEPASDREAQQQRDEAQYVAWLDARSNLTGTSTRTLSWLLVTVVQPLLDFFRRQGLALGISILLFIFLFKIGEAFLGRMAIVFYKEVGFSNTDIAVYSKLVGWWVTLVFALISGYINVRFGLIRGLLVGGIAMSATNLMFAVIAVVGPSKPLFALTVLLDNFTAALSTVTFVAFISYLTSRAYTASQYALMASLGNLGRTWMAAGSGLLVDGLEGDWATFFVITAVMVTPSLVLLLFIRQALTRRFAAPSAAQPSTP